MKVTFVTHDAEQLAFTCLAEQTLLEAAEAAGLYPAAMCRNGQCGQCVAQAISGSYSLNAHSPQALPNTNNAILLCSCLPLSDLFVALPYDNAQLSRRSVPTRIAVLEAFSAVGASSMSLTLRLQPDPQLGLAADFMPGQYMEIGLPDATLHRAYSLVNLPNWEGRLEFLVRLVPNGAFSTWLTQTAKVGDLLNVRGPLGRFTLDETSPRARWLVGGGCGFAPLLSMLRQMAEFGDSTPVHLIYGINHEQDALPDEIFAPLRSALSQLKITLAVWHGPVPDNAVAGTAAEVLTKLLAQESALPDLYVCGPPKMLDAVVNAAHMAGIDDEHIFYERL